jgi:hypothetical protein
MPSDLHQKTVAKHSVMIEHSRFAVRIVLLTLLNLSVGLGLTPSLLAQFPSVIDPTGRSGKPPEVTQPEPAPPSLPNFILPPVETLPELQPKRAPGVRVMVQTIRVEGSTVLSQEELSKITAPAYDLQGQAQQSQG